jgi:hypothetical protein
LRTRGTKKGDLVFSIRPQLKRTDSQEKRRRGRRVYSERFRVHEEREGRGKKGQDRNEHRAIEGEEGAKAIVYRS